MITIKNTSNITKKLYMRYYWFGNRKTLLYLAVLSAIFEMLNLQINDQGRNQLSSGFGFFTVILIIIVLLCIALLCYAPLRAYEKIKDRANEYAFNQETIEIENHRPMVNTHVSYRYAGLMKAYERKDAFYLFIDKRQAFLVSKSGFTQGSVDELRTLLINQLGNKFHYPSSKA